MAAPQPTFSVHIPAVKLKSILQRTLQTLLQHTKQEKLRTALIATSTMLTVAAATTYLVLISTASEDSPEQCEADFAGIHQIYPKEQWGGKPPSIPLKSLPHPIGLVIISHTGTPSCGGFASCAAAVRSLQVDHLAKGLADVCFNFLVGGDGSIFVGRGWGKRNCHSKLSIGVSFIGDFTEEVPSGRAVDGVQRLLALGVGLRKIAWDYLLVGHNQTEETLSPGENVYRVIKGFAHFTDIDIVKFV